MLDWMYSKLTAFIGKHGSPRQTYGEETEEVLRQRKELEEEAKKNPQPTTEGK